jgi:hypothetical protein
MLMDTTEQIDGLSNDAKALFDSYGKSPSPRIQTTQQTPQQASTEGLSKSQLLIIEHETESKKWTDIVKRLSDDLRDSSKIVDVQSDIYDRRQQITERKYELARVRAKYESIYKRKRYERLDFYATRYDRKLTAGEREKMVDSDVSEYKLILDLLDVQFNWSLDTLRTITDMSFGVRNRIDVDDALRRH